MKSLSATHHLLSATLQQRMVLEGESLDLPYFAAKLKDAGLPVLDAFGLDVLQVNLGLMCNQTCTHCHVDAGPDRKEKISRAILEDCLTAIKAHDIGTVDLTGGAPEMHPDFRWFVEQCAQLGKRVMVRCNLTIILANKKYHDLPEFYKKYQVEVVSSLPFYTADRTDCQCGKGVFEHSIEALKMLNTVGYGVEGSGLKLDLVYNPAGAFLPGSQSELKAQFKRSLMTDHGIVFNDLFAITNLPISRFLEHLVRTDQYQEYMEKLVNAFNPQAVAGVMCRNMISVSHTGSIYDCDFNQMLDIPLTAGMPKNISDLASASVIGRRIATGRHCFGCTAGAGSSCGGATA